MNPVENSSNVPLSFTDLYLQTEDIGSLPRIKSHVRNALLRYPSTVLVELGVEVLCLRVTILPNDTNPLPKLIEILKSEVHEDCCADHIAIIHRTAEETFPPLNNGCPDIITALATKYPKDSFWMKKWEEAEYMFHHPTKEQSNANAIGTWGEWVKKRIGRSLDEKESVEFTVEFKKIDFSSDDKEMVMQQLHALGQKFKTIKSDKVVYGDSDSVMFESTPQDDIINK